MSIEDAIFDRLDNYAGLSALVASRIYPVNAPQNATKPYVTYNRISGVRESLLATDTDIATPRFQISAWSDDRDEVVSVAAQIRGAFQRYSGTNAGIVIMDSYLVNDVDLYEFEPKMYQVAIDFEIWHRE